MSKYKNIEKALGLTEDRELAFDKYGGFYCNAPMVPTLEQTLEDFAQQSLAADAAIETLNKANETINNLYAKIDEMKAVTEEKDALIASLTQDKGDLSAEKERLTAELNSVKTDNSNKEDMIAKLTASVTDKESEIEELSKNTSSMPKTTPTRGMNNNIKEEQNHHFYKPGMSAQEAKTALIKRMRFLKTKF